MKLLKLTLMGCLILSGCDDAVETVRNDLQVDLRGCLGTTEAGPRSTCRSQISDRVAPSPVNGCLILAVGAGARIHYVGLRWENDWFTVADAPSIAGEPGEPIIGELYLFSDTDVVSCDRESLPFGVVCDAAAPWCLFKLTDSDSSVGIDGIRLDFGGDNGNCGPQGTLVSNPNTESCDGADNDCDGQVDEGQPGANVMCETIQPGACGQGTTACHGGEIVCDGHASTEICDGLDNDCDDLVDEDYQVGVSCSIGVGACQSNGSIVCDTVATSRCDAEPLPAMPMELCDGMDNDCDGMVDNRDVSTGTACDLSEQGVRGACVAGQNRCVDGDVVCEQTVEPGLEICNGTDDDCDGRQDEGFGVGQVCVSGRGECQGQGAIECDELGGFRCTAVDVAEPRQERCDGVDDDCDGRTDEGYDLGDVCRVGLGACTRSGVFQCTADIAQCSVVPGAPTVETCDGVDQDCDGRIDEEIDSVATDCGVGSCAAQGQRLCVQGGFIDTCRAGPQGLSDEDCDNADNDCDGQIDEAYVGEIRACGQGACRREAITACRAGQVIDMCQPGEPQPDAQCDGIDDDCNGVPDNDFVGAVTTCGQGICTALGVEDCRDGNVLDTCQAGPAEPNDTVCDGFDTDCDGRDDEGFAIQPTDCGTGPCLGAGELTCVDGAVVDSCQPGQAPSETDESCDGIDDDCSGRLDEDYPSQDTRCGQGLCASVGVSTCVGGLEGDTCQLKPGQNDDGACDGLDSDCDGLVDEHFQSLQTRCGIGVCSGIGNTACIDGLVSNSCTEGAPTSEDQDCNGLDDDCDESADEGYVNSPTQCGMGVCIADGQSRCESGVVRDDCQVGAPGGVDSQCDRTDSDCDGRFGEHFEPTVTTCGLGVCTTQGVLRCLDGSFEDNCMPLPDETLEVCGNLLDEDCDGQLDNGFNVQEPCSNGLGQCRVEGTILCDVGGQTSSCDAVPGDAVVETCNLTDDDCDGVSDEGFDLENDPEHCGGCNAACVLPDATVSCMDAQCTILDCDADFFDVDGDAANGCEYRCVRSAGGLEVCDGSDNDCDGSIDEAFDLSNDDQNCGGCGVQCEFAHACVNGGCELVPCQTSLYTIGETSVGTTDGQPNVHAAACEAAHGVELVYHYLTPNSGRRVCLTTSGSAIDTVLSVRSSTCQGNSLACKTDSATDGVGAQVEVDLRKNRLYLFIIDTIEPESGIVRLSSSRGRCNDNTPPIECLESDDCLLPGQQCVDTQCAPI